MTSSTCCGCIPVMPGVITLGVISLLGGVGDIIFGSIIINNNDHYYCTSYYDFNCYTTDGYSWYGTTSIVQGSIGIIVSLLLIIGVSNRKPNLLMPYVTMMIVNIMAYVSVAIVLLANTDTYSGAYYGIWYLCWSCILGYFVSVVRLYRVLMIQQFQSANGLVTTYSSGAILTPGVMINPYPSVATVYHTQPGYTAQTVNINQQGYPAPGSYPQPGYPQQGYPQQGYPQQQGIYPPQNSYPPPYPGNQPNKF